MKHPTIALTPAKMEMPMSTTWFVGADWLAEHIIDNLEIQIIDARMRRTGQEDRNVAREYLMDIFWRSVLISKRFLITLPRFRTCCRRA